MCDELRAGTLSETNYQYLHGEPVAGCTLSEEERAARRRLITGPDDERLQLDKFKEAPVIVANNDAKCEINKHRAKHFARNAGVPVLQVEACEKDTKIRNLGFMHRNPRKPCNALNCPEHAEVAAIP